MKWSTLSSTDPRPPLWLFILSHHSYSKLSHTIRVSLGTREVYLCARCTGIGVGMLIGLSYVNYLAYDFLQYPVLIVGFVLLAIVAWLFQVFSLNDRTTSCRLVNSALVC